MNELVWIETRYVTKEIAETTGRFLARQGLHCELSACNLMAATGASPSRKHLRTKSSGLWKTAASVGNRKNTATPGYEHGCQLSKASVAPGNERLRHQLCRCLTPSFCRDRYSLYMSITLDVGSGRAAIHSLIHFSGFSRVSNVLILIRSSTFTTVVPSEIVTW